MLIVSLLCWIRGLRFHVPHSRGWLTFSRLSRNFPLRAATQIVDFLLPQRREGTARSEAPQVTFFVVLPFHFLRTPQSSPTHFKNSRLRYPMWSHWSRPTSNYRLLWRVTIMPNIRVRCPIRYSPRSYIVCSKEGRQALISRRISPNIVISN